MKVYIAIPYTGIEEESFKIANKIASELINLAYTVYSPITHNHPIAKSYNLPTDWEFWKEYDSKFIEWCDVLYVVYPDIDGYDKDELVKNSKGVQAEMEIARKLNKHVLHYYHNKNK